MHLERLTAILEIAGQKGEATVADICAHADLPKPTAYRLVHDLVAVGLLDPVGKRRFSVGTRLKQIAQSDHSDASMISVVGPALKQAAAQHGAAFFLSRLRGRHVEIIHVETPENGVSFLHPGLGKRPLHACSCAKAVAAFAPDLVAIQTLAGRLKAYTPFTLTQLGDLETELSRIRQRGYAECVEELERGMCSVATTLAADGAGATLSIGATGSTRVFTEGFRAKIGRELCLLAQKLADEMKWIVPASAPRSA